MVGVGWDMLWCEVEEEGGGRVVGGKSSDCDGFFAGEA